jgi:hypothetical protein
VKSTSPKLGETPNDAPSGPTPKASLALGAVTLIRVTARPPPADDPPPMSTLSRPRRGAHHAGCGGHVGTAADPHWCRVDDRCWGAVEGHPLHGRQVGVRLVLRRVRITHVAEARIGRLRRLVFVVDVDLEVGLDDRVGVAVRFVVGRGAVVPGHGPAAVGEGEDPLASGPVQGGRRVDVVGRGAVGECETGERLHLVGKRGVTDGDVEPVIGVGLEDDVEIGVGRHLQSEDRARYVDGVAGDHAIASFDGHDRRAGGAARTESVERYAGVAAACCGPGGERE